MLKIYRIQEVETKIGGGLIEEVIQVAEGELQLVNEMAESKVSVQSPINAVSAD